MTEFILIGIGAFATGLVVGVVLRDALELVTREDRVNPRMHRIGRWLANNIMLFALFFVVILQAAVGILLITTKNDLSRTVQCQASYNQQFSTAYRARVASSRASGVRLDRVFFTVFAAMQSENPEIDARFNKALEEYVKARREQLREQRLNPYPPLPNRYCDEF